MSAAPDCIRRAAESLCNDVPAPNLAYVCIEMQADADIALSQINQVSLVREDHILFKTAFS